MRFLALPLLLPESSQAGGSTEFPGFRLLVLGYGHGVLETGCGFGVVVWGLCQEEFPLETIHFCCAPTLLIGIDECEHSAQHAESDLGLSTVAVRVREEEEIIQRIPLGSV